mmetsp:Transcript_1847/g.3300  ORF Transcript_1847/g.3300 Transcript_1847/m.3300 type:complete len:618 (-) Transcript_1847:1253-3106(-)
MDCISRSVQSKKAVHGFSTHIVFLLLMIPSFLAASTKDSTALVNQRITRSIKFSGSASFDEISATIQNTGSETINQYQIYVHESDKSNVRHVLVSFDSNCFTQSSNASKFIPAKSVINEESGDVVYSVPIKDGGLQAGETLDIFILMIRVGDVSPNPKEMKQSEKQTLTWTGSSLFYSPYKTMEEKCIFSTRGVNRGSFGPYENTHPFSRDFQSIWFPFREPVLIADYYGKSVTISHWGNINVVEHYVIRNVGARLKGEFSQVNHVSEENQNVMNGAVFRLPPSATNVYYRDAIGNITTSSLKRATFRYRVLEAAFRFPLYGGWKNDFWISYDLPPGDFLGNVPGSTEMSFVFSLQPTLYLEHLAVNQFDVKVSIHGSIGEIRRELPTLLNIKTSSISREKAALSVRGAVAVTANAKNIVMSQTRAESIAISYRTSPFALLEAPLLVAAMLLILFTTIMAYARISSNLVLSAEDTYRYTEALQKPIAQVLGIEALVKEKMKEIHVLLKDYKIPDQSKFFVEKANGILISLNECKANLIEVASTSRSDGFDGFSSLVEHASRMLLLVVRDVEELIAEKQTLVEMADKSSSKDDREIQFTSRISETLEQLRKHLSILSE